MSDIKVSIIIPHFNLPRLLMELLDSIPDIPEIQVIVVDDNSQKNLDVLEECRKKYSSRNVEFYKNNREKGAGNSRNVGLEHAKGEWLMFADSDDRFLEGFYDKVAEYFNKDIDLVLFVPTSLDIETGKISNRHETFKKHYMNYYNNPTLKNEVRARYRPVAPWSKLMRRSVITENDIWFQNSKVGNDAMFSAMSSFYCKRMCVDTNEIYCNYYRGGSLTTQLDVETMRHRASVLAGRYRFLKEHLSKKEMKYLGLSGLDIYLLDLKYGHGLMEVFRMMKYFRKQGVKVIDWGEFFKLFRLSTLKRIKK